VQSHTRSYVCHLNLVTRGRNASLGLIVGCLLLAGCNRSGLDLAHVEGVVTYKGAPVEQAGVLFKPQKGPMAIGTTDSSGRFTLMTANKDGALVGEHHVSISKTEQLATPVAGERFPRYQTKFLIPQKYGSPETSGLTATVDRKKNQVEFKLD
jgi:hypothetical protein